jgi:myxalamid-type polyketide synthase MxaB
MSTPPKDNRDLLKRALLKIDNLQAQLDKQREPIAIVGMSLRFPNGANDPEKFWQLLREGVDCITEIPASRWNVEDYYDPDPDAPGKMYTRCAGFIDNVEQFDPQFFGIAPREAQSMDPQQRLLLEVTWEALEAAGQAPSRLIGSRTGVYVGISGNDYSHLNTSTESIDTYFGAGVAHSIAAGRISYVLGLQGPSVAVDTACSASLTAVHLACQSLRSGETDMALAGGVNVILTPEGIITASQARMLSPEGRCKTFDASANGYVRSEGCAMIVLKRLSDAKTNGDNILAIIRGAAANQDGRSGGLTAPNGEAQQAVIRAALANANLKPEDISYLETHGTGTSLGDPIEVQAIGAVFGASHSKENPLLIGAVKSNLGHLEAAAGIAGLIKTVLALQHAELPPSLHVRQLNPHIAWERLPVKVTTELTPWLTETDKRIAGVSSFGFSGTNVHVVVEEFREQSSVNSDQSSVISDQLSVSSDQSSVSSDQSSVSSDQSSVSSAKPAHLLALSANNDVALRELAQRYEQYLTMQSNSPLEGGVARDEANTFANICFTANAGRAHFNHRLALVAETREQARAQLAAFVNDEKPAGLQSGKIEEGHRAEIAFLFTGQGAQYLNMGKRLYETQPVFRAALDKCDALLRPYLEVSLLEVLFDNQSSTPSSQSVILEGPSLALGTIPGAREVSSRMTTQEGVRSPNQTPVILEGPSLALETAPSAGEGSSRMTTQEGVRSPNQTPVILEGPSLALETAPSAGEGSSRMTVQEGVRAPNQTSVILEEPSPELGTVPSAREVSSRMTRQIEGANDQSSLNTDHQSLNTDHRPLVTDNCSLITDHLLHQTAYTQPALFALEYALAELWRSWGIVPFAVMGHSVGEYVAACVAGVFSLEDGLKLIAARARLMQALPQNGTMAAVFANEETVRKALLAYQDRVDVAAINGPSNVVLSGEREALYEILSKLASEGIKHKPLAVSHAFHSPLMEPMLDEFERIANEVQYAAPRIPLVSNITGDFVADDEIADAHYWRKHVREAVRFSEAMTRLHEHGCKIFVELGPTPTLLSMGQRCLPDETRCAWLPSLRKGREDERQIFETLAGLYVQGVNVDWPRFYQREARRRIVLPTYPFQRQRYWAKAAERRAKGKEQGAWSALRLSHPLLGARLRSALKETQFEAQIDIHTQAFLREHQFYGTPVFPAAAYVETALAAAQEIFGAGAHALEQFNIHEALMLPDDESRCVQFIFTPESEHAGAFQIFSARVDDERAQWTLHASGMLRAHAETKAAPADLPTLQQRCGRAFDAAAYYEKFRNVGVEYGPSFQGLARLWQGEGEALAEIRLNEDAASHFHFHPGLLDACFQLFGATIFDEEETAREAKVYMPASCERLAVYRERVRAFWCHAQLHEGRDKEGETLRGDLFLFDEKNGPIAKIESLRFKRARRTALQKMNHDALAEWLYEVQWQKQALAEAARTNTSSANGAWAIFVDEQGLGASLAEQLRAQNIRAALVRKGASFARVNEHEWQLNPQQREEFARFLAEAFPQGSECANVVYGWSLDAVMADSSSAEELLAAERLVCEGALHLVQALTQAGALNPPRLWLLTCGAHVVGAEHTSSQHVPNNSPLEGGQGGVAHETHDLKKENTPLTPLKGGIEEGISPVQTSLWGLANVIALEHPALQCSSIDLETNVLAASRPSALVQASLPADKMSALHEVALVLDEILAHTREPRIALRNNERFVARVMPLSTTSNQQPASSIQQPTTSIQQPTTSIQQPTTSNQQPTTSNQHPATSIQHPATSIQQPTTSIQHPATSIQQPLKLEIRERGVLENLKLVPQTRRAPHRGEVEVRVHATGLNFRDVLNALGMYPGDPGPLGNECVGKIVALGEGVHDLKLGEEVMALAADSFASYVTTDARFILPMPKALSAEEAATLPITFLTAHYALHHLAQMKAGERVLIHAAAGGVGLAAIQLAQRAGAEIFATASSAEKHEHLRSLGVKNIFSSRTLDFAEEIMRATNGEGIDLVLNSLAGEFIPKSLSLLRFGGRFLEIGKTEVWNEARVKALVPEIAYHVIYLGEIIHEQPALMRALLEELTRAFEAGALRPLPFKSFPLGDAVHAFRYMAQARHIGKVVLVIEAEDRGSRVVDRKRQHPQRDPLSTINNPRSTTHNPQSSIFDPHSAILLTGGLGALGLHVAKWLVENGARHLVLAGRKAPSAIAQAAIVEMEKLGARIVVAPIDISQEEEVRRVLDEITRTLPPLRGVIHSAGVLEDGVLVQQDWPRFERVMAPKVLGAWHLHRLTKDLPLDFFVLFSSIAAMFGAPSQGNYAAANAFMDGLAFYRRKQGLPALSLNWGPWAEGGMVTELGNRGEARLAEQGLRLIKPEQGLQALARLLRGVHAQAAVLPVNWTKFSRQFQSGEEPPLFGHVLKAFKPQLAKPQAQTARDLVKELEAALPAERLPLLTAHVREQVVKVLGLDATQTPALHQGLTALGMDSLMAVELSNRLRGSLGHALPATIAFEYPSIAALTQYLATEVLQWETSSKTEAESNDAQNGRAHVQQEIEQIAEGELEDSLLQELEEAGY